MNAKLVESAPYAAKTLFFLFVGGLFMMLFGYVLVGIPVAGSAGLPYGIRLALVFQWAGSSL